MPPLIDLTGQRFGKLVVISRGHKDEHGNIHWNCHCDCGNETSPLGGSLRSSLTRSCGCLSAHYSKHREQRPKKHGNKMGGKPTPEYVAWAGMHTRCTNPKTIGWKHYGGRGVRVCQAWANFETFLKDMGRKPSSEHSLDRYPDPDGNYEPNNCRWATKAQQRANRSA